MLATLSATAAPVRAVFCGGCGDGEPPLSGRHFRSRRGRLLSANLPLRRIESAETSEIAMPFDFAALRSGRTGGLLAMTCGQQRRRNRARRT
jgi:hypothetical protein